MSAICVAILDDGVGRDILQGIDSRVIWKDAVPEEGIEGVPSHGSRVVATIEKYHPSPKQYWIYNIFQKDCPSKRVIEILEELLYESVDVIVMSFHISNTEQYKPLEEICAKLQKKGVILVASDTNCEREVAMPATLPSVVGVGGIKAEGNKLFLGKKSGIQVYANVLPEFVQIGKKYWLFSGTSKANGIVAAEVIRLLEEGICGYTVIIKELKKRCMKEQEALEQGCITCVNPVLHEEVLKLLCKQGFIQESKTGKIYLPECILDIDELGEQVCAILRNYHQKDWILQLKYSDFETTYAIVRFLEKRNEEEN